MINIYDLYKPLRNHLRKIDLRSLLWLIWKAQQGLNESGLVEVRGGTGNHIGSIFGWELHILAREALLHSTDGTTQQYVDTNGLIELINHLRRIAEGISERTINSGGRAMRELHPLMHQQARWQHPRDWDRFFRAFRIYNSENVRPMLEQTVGIRLSSIFTMALAIAGNLRNTDEVCSNVDYTGVGVSSAERDAFFAMVGADHSTIHGLLKSSQRYDQGWAHSWNVLEAMPLVRLRFNHLHEYQCPLPGMLLRRVTEGLFYDLAKSDFAFGNAYGRAFEGYVGDVLRAQFRDSTHCVIEEQMYEVKKNIKHGVDWIVSDSTGHIMVECKARRMRFDAKVTADGDSLDLSLDDLAASVVQHYRNVDDAKKGRTHWVPDDLPVFLFIITYEDWYLFAPHVVDRLHELVRERLMEIGLAALMEVSPFIVTSIAEFERAGQAIAHIGIGPFCASRVEKPYRHFGLGTYAGEAFPTVMVPYQRLFPSSDQEMLGHLSHLMELPGQLEKQM